MSRPLQEDQTLQTAAKLHTAGPNIQGSYIRLDLLGPAASGSGPSLSKERDADLSWVERVDGGGYCEPNRDWQGSTEMCSYGNLGKWVIYGHVPCYRWDASPLCNGPYIREALRVSRVSNGEFPN